MASKSSSKTTHDPDSHQEVAKSNSPTNPSPSQRPPRMKSIPNRYHYGIDRAIRGVSDNIPEASSANPKRKGVSFEDQIPPPKKKRTATKLVTSKEKERKKQKEVPEPSKKKSQHARTKRATTSSFTTSPEQSPSKSSTSSHTQTEGETPSVVANAIEEIYKNPDPPRGFSTANTLLTEAQSAQFKEKYMKKDFCSVVSVDLAQLQQECNVNLSPWLTPYNSFTSISAPYTPNLIRLFYFNMVSDNILDIDGELVEERITTTVRNVTFTLSASIINRILKIDNSPDISTPTYSNKDIFSTLRPNEEFPENQSHILSFKPGSMPPLNRVLWYIYSRNFVQKGGSFTHFSQKDYRFFTAFVKKHPFNLGHWIYQEMIKFKFSSRKASYFPFPSLISVILFYHKIWYVGPPEVMKYPPVFGKAQLNLMKIAFEPEGSGHSRAPSRSQARASQGRSSQARAQEAHSAPSPPSSLPSDFDARIKAIVDAAVASFTLRLDFEMGKLRHDLNQASHLLKEQFDSLCTQNQALQDQVDQLSQKNGELSDHIIDLDARQSTQYVLTNLMSSNMDKIIAHFKIGSSDASGSSTPKAAPSSPPFSFHASPLTTVSPEPSTPLFNPSPSSPSTPATEILPTPATEPLHQFTHPTPILNLPSESPLSAPSHFEDDKGGEKKDKKNEE